MQLSNALQPPVTLLQKEHLRFAGAGNDGHTPPLKRTRARRARKKQGSGRKDARHEASCSHSRLPAPQTSPLRPPRPYSPLFLWSFSRTISFALWPATQQLRFQIHVFCWRLFQPPLLHPHGFFLWLRQAPNHPSHSGYLLRNALHRSLVAILAGAWFSSHSAAAFWTSSKILLPVNIWQAPPRSELVSQRSVSWFSSPVCPLSCFMSVMGPSTRARDP